MRTGERQHRGRRPEAPPDETGLEQTLDIEEMKQVVGRLTYIRSKQDVLAQETGYRDQNLQSLDACIRELGASPRAALKDVRISLFKHSIPEGVIAFLEKQTKKGLTPKSEELQEFVQARCRESIQSLEFKNDGDKFLQDIVVSSVKGKNVDIHHARTLRGLEIRLRQRGYTEKDVGMMYVMYAALGQLSQGIVGQAHEDVLLDKFSTVIEARLKGDPENIREEGSGNFFRRLSQCVAVYADISQKVLRLSGEGSEDIQKRATRALSLFFQRPELQEVRWSSDDPAVDPFGVLQNLLREKPADNPWLIGSLVTTPFSEKKFWSLITPDVPRGLLAEAIVLLNNYQAELLAQHAQGIETSIDKTKPDKQIPQKEIEILIKEYFDLYPQRRRNYDSIEDKVGLLHEMTQISTWSGKQDVPSSKHMHPIAALLRIVDPKKIITDKTRQSEFKLLFQKLDVPSTPEWIAMIASSVADVLRDSDPHLDMPLLGHQLGAREDRSLRTILTEYARSYFDDEVIRRGPYVYLDGQVPRERPLYTPADLREYERDPRRLEALKKDFDTAAGTDPLVMRQWLIEAARKWNEIPDSYRAMLGFAMDQAQKFHGVGDACSVAFYRSATIAMGDVIGKLIPIQQGDRVIITNQEYGSITGEFVKHGAQKISHDDIVYMNDRSQGRSRTPEEMYARIKERIQAGKTPKIPKAIILSSKSRLGDALCTGNEKRPNASGIQRLIKLIKSEFPTIPIIVDACQSFGRNDELENKVDRLGCDIFIASGSKAMGVDNVATLVLRTKYPKGQATWLDALDEKTRKNPSSVLQPGVATDSITSMAALGMAMQVQSGAVDSWSMQKIPDKSSLREVTAERMRRLTKYFIETASNYHIDLFTNPQPRFPISVSDSDARSKNAEQFGCQIVYPVHRVVENYNGIVTITFPNIAELVHEKRINDPDAYKSDYLPEELGKKGFKVLQCLRGYHGLRVSFHMLHDTKDVDALFASIKEIHIEYLQKQIKDKKISTFAELCAKTSKVPSDWIPD